MIHTPGYIKHEHSTVGTLSQRSTNPFVIARWACHLRNIGEPLYHFTDRTFETPFKLRRCIIRVATEVGAEYTNCTGSSRACSEFLCATTRTTNWRWGSRARRASRGIKHSKMSVRHATEQQEHTQEQRQQRHELNDFPTSIRGTFTTNVTLTEINETVRATFKSFTEKNTRCKELMNTSSCWVSMRV